MILVSNDFPPKVGGIQNYLYELWSRLPLETKVITTKYKGAKDFDAKQNFDVERFAKILWPTPKLVKKVNDTVLEMDTDIVFIDPLLPTGLITPKIKSEKKVLIVHGAEVTVPSRIYPTRQMIKHMMKDCDAVVSAGNYAARELVRAIGKPIDMLRIPPGVDIESFHMPSEEQKSQARASLFKELAIDQNSRIIMSASRVVPRKGFDNAILALSDLQKDIHLVIVGKGRDEKRLRSLTEKFSVSNRVHFLGKISHEKLVATFHASDLFLMLCRDRWGSLEAEGFGIVFLEAAACGLPVVAGRSGGSPEALIDNKTGFVVDPQSISEIRKRITEILDDVEMKKSFGEQGRKFVEQNHSYDLLAAQLLPLVTGDLSVARKFDG